MYTFETEFGVVSAFKKQLKVKTIIEQCKRLRRTCFRRAFRT